MTNHQLRLARAYAMNYDRYKHAHPASKARAWRLYQQAERRFDLAVPEAVDADICLRLVEIERLHKAAGKEQAA